MYQVNSSFFLTFIPFIALVVLTLVSIWKVFEKAGKPGWAAIIPFYNGWVLAEVGSRPAWWGLVSFLGLSIEYSYAKPATFSFLSILCYILYAMIVLGIAKNFKKSTGFAILTMILPFVGFTILAFGNDKYTKSAPMRSFKSNTSRVKVKAKYEKK
jgi:hypothetical protein